MFVVVIAKDKPDSHALRASTKEKHIAYLDAAAPGLCVLQTGPLLGLDDVERGSLLILEADSLAVAEAYFRADPYVKAGLFSHYEIHPWNWRRGNPYLREASAQTSTQTRPL